MCVGRCVCVLYHGPPVLIASQPKQGNMGFKLPGREGFNGINVRPVLVPSLLEIFLNPTLRALTNIQRSHD